MVIQLIRKDLTYLTTSLKSTVWTLVIFSLCMPLLSLGLGCAIPALVCYIGFYNTLAYEERNKADLLNLALPVSRKDICLSKYIQVCLFIVVSSFLAVIGLMIKGYTSYEAAFLRDYLKEIIPLMLSVAMIYSAIVLPCVFYFGTLKSRYILLFIYMLIFIVGNSAGMIDMEHMFEEIQKVCGAYISVVSLLGAGIIFIISYFISLRIWERKAF